MTGTRDYSDEEPVGGCAPCSMHEIGPDGTLGIDLRQARDVARWRKAERERLIAARVALSAEYRTSQTTEIAKQLDQFVASEPTAVVSVYWPIRGEPDLRPWMRAAWSRGVRIALPVAVSLAQPLTFREWCPGAPMAHGLWKIPYPADGAEVTPAIVLAPLVGFDSGCYRLGYGGGFFDRTLAAMTTKRLAIGLGYPDAAIPTIFPQPHDVPMDVIVTGATAPRHRMAER